MNNKQDIFLSSIPLTAIPYCSFLDHYIFKDPISGYNIVYPLSVFGGEFTTSAYTSGVSGGPFVDVCFQDYCLKTTTLPPIKLYCVTTVNFVLTGIDQNDGEVIEVVYNFDDGSPQKEVSFIKNENQFISPLNIPVTKTYYPSIDSISKTYTPSISVIRNDCCINTYKITLCAFKCSILEMYEDVILHNAQQSTDYNVILTLEKRKDRQLFKNALDLSNIVFAVPVLSTLPYLVEPVPPDLNKPKPEPLVPKIPTPPTNFNPIELPERSYFYTQGEGIDLIPDLLKIVPSQDIYTFVTSGLTISGDGPPYLQSEGIDIRFT